MRLKWLDFFRKRSPQGPVDSGSSDTAASWRRNAGIAASGKETEQYLMHLDTQQVIRHNTLMNGVTSTRGEAMGFVQENNLSLNGDGTFTLVKELKTTKTNLMFRQPVSVRYSFSGGYVKTDADHVRLSEAKSASGSVNWGTLSRFLETGDGEYDSQSSPGILSLYPTAFFVENCKNVPMEVRLNREDHSFTIEDFEPVILSAEEAGSVQKKEAEISPEAGLMKHPLTEDPDAFSLKDTYQKNEMKIGTCINPEAIRKPYEDILLKQFSSVTLENHLKPSYTLSWEESVKNGKLTVRFSEETVLLLNWCKEHGMPFRGHTLIWYMGTPEWIFHEAFTEDAPNVGRKEMIRRMEDYIAGYFRALTAGGWADLMYCLDVVNEAVITPDQMRKCQWLEIIGEDYLKLAYTFARKYAPPQIKLCYNDFDLETKTDKVIGLVRDLVDPEGKSMVDIVGQQGHYGAYSSIDSLGKALEKIGRETGCELQITELDVSVSRNGTEEELRLQGRFYYNFVQQIFDLNRKGIRVSGLTLWGFTDAVTWMPGGFLHPYDRNLVPKYAYFGLLGLKDLSGFDGEERRKDNEDQNQGTVFVDARYASPEDLEKSIRLFSDGTYTDTVTGSLQKGKYRGSGENVYMLIPEAGSYCNLILSEDGKAQRIEAAGNRTELVRS